MVGDYREMCNCEKWLLWIIDERHACYSEKVIEGLSASSALIHNTKYTVTFLSHALKEGN